VTLSGSLDAYSVLKAAENVLMTSSELHKLPQAVFHQNLKRQGEVIKKGQVH
jgi:hypothetical protein